MSSTAPSTEKSPLQPAPATAPSHGPGRFQGLEGAGSSYFHRLAIPIFVCHLALGTLVFHLLEDLSYRDSLYFSVVTLTTVGYGDIVPRTVGGKLFNVFYLVVSLSVVATSIGTIASSVSENWFQATKKIIMFRSRGGAEQKHVLSDERIYDLRRRLAMTVAVVLMVVGVGVVWGVFGNGFDLVDAVYWAAVTSATVGYGVLPMNDATRNFNIFYLPISVTAFAFAIGKVVELIGVIEQKRRLRHFVAQGVTPDVILEIARSSGTMCGLDAADKGQVRGRVRRMCPASPRV